jgi:hypothetical protein
LDGLDRGANELDSVALQNAVLIQRDRGVERRLTAQSGEQRVRTLLRYDHLDELRCDGLDVGRIGELWISHDRRRVGVDQDHPEAFIPQHPARLSAGIVEFAGLANDDRARPDDEDGCDIGPARHYTAPP